MKKILLHFAVLMLLNSCGTTHNSPYQYDLNPDLSKIKYSGGNGSNYEEAIVIENAKNSSEGIAAEYAYLNDKHGKRNIDWNLLMQSLDRKNDKKYDILTITRTLAQDTISVYFDITDFFGK